MPADHDIDLGPAFRAALLDPANNIAGDLALWEGEAGVFTRRPVPAEADYPMVLVNLISVTDEDGVNSDRPVCMYDLATYGLVGKPGTSEDQTRIVEQLANRQRRIFHRQRFALQVEGFHVIDVRATGPVPAPVDDDKEMGRVVSLIVRLRRV